MDLNVVTLMNAMKLTNCVNITKFVSITKVFQSGIHGLRDQETDRFWSVDPCFQ